MFERIRRNFIIVAVCAVVAVLAAVLVIINAVNYANITQAADAIVEILAQSGGTLPDELQNGLISGSDLSPEASYTTRYFTVTLTDGGQVIETDVEHIASVTEETAERWASALYTKGKTSGFYEDFRYGTVSSTERTMYIFLDRSEELSGYYSFLWISVAVGACGAVAVFLIIFFFSGQILKPVAESYDKQKRFITDAGHELKTPVTIISADAEILEMTGGENEWTKDIRDQTKRLASLTENLVFLARMDESQKLMVSDFCISDAVSESLQPYRAVAETNGLRIRADIAPALTYCGNETMIRRLVSILLDNAMKYADTGTKVAVSLHKNGDRTCLVTENSAAYMKDGNLDRLFERFYREDSSRNSKTGGSGVGLSMAQSIVSAHKGKIRAVCKNGTVTFTVTL